jgi:hypothetical protein
MLTCAPDLATGYVGTVPGTGVDELQIGAEHSFPFQPFDVSFAAGMNRDRNFEATRGRPIFVRDFEQNRVVGRYAGWIDAARRHSECQ